MFCPQCGQERMSTETSFCSRCGFLLTGTADVLQNGGLIPYAIANQSTSISPRSRGLRQGLFIFLLTFLVVPIVAIVSIALNDSRQYILSIVAILFFIGGLLRMVYAMLFEEPAESAAVGEPAERKFVTNKNNYVLPPVPARQAERFSPPQSVGRRNTNDLTPPAVTEGTTKLLEKEESL